MARRFHKRKERKTWRVVPARITPKRKKLDRIPRILRAYALAHASTAPASASSTLIETLNQHLRGTEWRLSPEILRAWERDIIAPEDELLRTLARKTPPLSWCWLLAHDLLAAKHPQHYQPRGIIGRRILNH